MPNIQVDTKPSRLVLAGYGGFGRELVGYVQTMHDGLVAMPRGFGPVAELPRCIACVDDVDPSELAAHQGVQWIGTFLDYQSSPGDQVLIAVGSPRTRAMLWQKMLGQNAVFTRFIHPTAIVARSAQIGQGAIIGPFAMISDDAILGDNVLVNAFASVGHGASVGPHSVISPYAAVLGDATLGTECFLGTRATVFPQVQLGNRCIVDAHSFAKMDVPDDHIVRCRTEYQVIRNRLVDSERKP
ncbi:MAG: acetyltransferase [Pirellulaceae bacterium]|nr:acetyltransferase [Pirellulaceae bacterium]